MSDIVVYSSLRLTAALVNVRSNQFVVDVIAIVVVDVHVMLFELGAEVGVHIPQVRANGQRRNQICSRDGAPVERVQQPVRGNGQETKEQRLEGHEQQGKAEHEARLLFGLFCERGGKQSREHER